MTAEMVDHPAHYQTAAGIEAIDVIEDYGLASSWHIADAMTYLLRAGKKGDLVTDLRKARWYLDRWLKRDFPSPEYGRTRDRNPNDYPRPEHAGTICDAFGLSGHVATAVAALLLVSNPFKRMPRKYVADAIVALDAAIAEVDAGRSPLQKSA